MGGGANECPRPRAGGAPYACARSMKVGGGLRAHGAQQVAQSCTSPTRSTDPAPLRPPLQPQRTRAKDGREDQELHDAPKGDGGVALDDLRLARDEEP